MEPRPPPGRSTPTETRELLPALAPRDPTAAYLFYDCQTDDARLVLTVLGEAERFGAVLRELAARSTGLVERTGAPAAWSCATASGGGEFEIEADNVINATGVWADRIRPDELYGEEEVPAHPALAAARTSPCRARTLDVVAGAIVPAGGGRTIFVLPWLGRTLIGTTDNDYEGELEHIPPSEDDVDYLLVGAQRVLRHLARRRPTSPAPTRASGR